MKALATQSNSGSVTDAQRAYLDAEYQELNSEIDGIAEGTRYNGESLLDGSSDFASGVNFMVGTSTTDVISVTIDSATSADLGIGSTSITSQTNAVTAIGLLDAAIGTVSNQRAEIGASMSRFDFRADTIASSTENMQAANSAIEDVDVATEQTKLSSAEVKTQAAIAALSTANDMPQNLLDLLR
jgi:flagellin